MVNLRHEVSHECERRVLLTEWNSGKVTKDTVCDADFLLLTAAKYHGEPSPRKCPICGGDGLRNVYWIHGEALGRRSGTARSLAEVELIAREGLEFSLHTVEVCPACRWNFLLRQHTVSP